MQRRLRRRDSGACDWDGEIANAMFAGEHAHPSGFPLCCRALCMVVGSSRLPQAP